MRNLRLLGQGVWYGIRTRINNHEPLFRRPDALALFARVFRLPEIMKWLKQVFAQRFNGMDGRAGHIWGDRY
jgi:hypothetical protein